MNLLILLLLSFIKFELSSGLDEKLKNKFYKIFVIKSKSLENHDIGNVKVDQPTTRLSLQL